MSNAASESGYDPRGIAEVIYTNNRRKGSISRLHVHVKESPQGAILAKASYDLSLDEQSPEIDVKKPY